MQTEIDRLLSIVGRDAENCATHVYIYLTFSHFVEKRAEFLEVLNRDPSFWNAHTYGHLTAAFVSLGRLYETKSDHVSLASLLSLAQENVHIFSRESLARRRQLAGMSASEAARFVEDAFVADKAFLSDIRKCCGRARNVYLEKAKPIRDKVFAHTSRAATAELRTLYQEFLSGDFGNLAVLPLRIHNALFQLYHNGSSPTLRDAPTRIEEVLAAKPGKHYSTWHHLHVAADTAAFIERLCVESPAGCRAT